jgi:prepilin-type N-terminal cleavage/methylation domain-containing protein
MVALNNNGFTLLESLMAMLVLTIGIMALYTLQISSIQGNATANHLSVASASGVNGFEHLLCMPYDDPTMDPAGNPHDQSEITGLQLQSNVAAIVWNVTEWTNTDGIDNDGDGNTDESDELDVKLVQLSVSYSDGSDNKTLTTEFLKTEMY